MRSRASFAGICIGLTVLWNCTQVSFGQAPAKSGPEADKLNALEKELVVDLGGNVKMEFVLVRPGTFTMGDEEAGSLFPLRKVTLTQPFYLGKYEVTQEQWEKVIGSNPSNFKGAKNPVETVSWDDCQSFLAKLKEKAPGHQFALPTEAQWEYACRAGSATDPGNLGEFGWSGSAGPTHPVGEKKPNPWGLYDMRGNVWEWCADWYGPYSTAEQTDPTGAASGRARVLRGGRGAAISTKRGRRIASPAAPRIAATT